MMTSSSSEYIVTEHCLENWDEFVASHETNSTSHTSKDCTIFTFSRRVPVDRWATRIGGTPAWSISTPWPVCSVCTSPLSFVSQLNFSESCMEFDTPGDVLIFHYCFECKPYQTGDCSSVLWKSISDEKLVENAVVPDSILNDEPGPCLGIPHKRKEHLASNSNHPSDSLISLSTKIGGYPPELQPIQPPFDSENRPMNFLASVGSVIGTDIPKSQSAEPIGDLIWFDMGCVMFWGAKTTTGFETRWFIVC